VDAESGVEPERGRKTGDFDGAGGLKCVTPPFTSNGTTDTLRMQQSTSYSLTYQAISEWHTYVLARSQAGLGLSSTLITRLASADWNARQAGPPTITAQHLAAAATNLINNKLNSMMADEQSTLYENMYAVMTPKGMYSLDSVTPNVTATQGEDGKWTVTVSAAAFSDRKTLLRQLSPGMLSSYAEFYPGEAALVFYSVATDDVGYGNDFLVVVRKAAADLTGLDLSSQYLFGENGFYIRRPIATFLNEQSMGQLFSEFGF
jgi:hypothetical protein